MNRSILGLLLVSLVIAACSEAVPATPAATPSAGPSEPTGAPLSPTPTSMPSPTPAPTPVSMPTVVFEPAEVPETDVGSSITAVAPGGDGLVAIGFNGHFGSILWTSTDGAAWRDVTPTGFAGNGMASVIRTSDDRLLGVGRGDTTNVDANVAAAFISEDGLVWRSATGAAELRGQMIDVVETDDGFSAIGGVPGVDSARVWRSRDGETWEQVGEDLPASFFWSVAEGGPGLVVAGWRRNPEPDAAVWSSSDAGTTWELAEDPELGTQAEGTDVLATDSGALIMVGGSFVDDGARIWTSPDGSEWSLADVEGGLGDASVRNVVATPVGHLALGGVDGDAAAWLSTDDGATWAPFGERVTDAYFHHGYVTDAGLFLVGATQTGTLETGIQAHAAIWSATIDE